MKPEKALSKRAFMQITGFSFQAARQIWNDPSFPKVAEKVFWSDFVAWRRRNLKAPRSHTPPNPAPDAGHTTNEPTPKSGSQVALPPRAARLRASFA
jgi:hypothetical protein